MGGGYFLITAVRLLDVVWFSSKRLGKSPSSWPERRLSRSASSPASFSRRIPFSRNSSSFSRRSCSFSRCNSSFSRYSLRVSAANSLRSSLSCFNSYSSSVQRGHSLATEVGRAVCCSGNRCGVSGAYISPCPEISHSYEAPVTLQTWLMMLAFGIR